MIHSFVACTSALFLIASPSQLDTGPSAEVARLEFHSSFWLNLHHTLYAAAWAKRPEGGHAEGPGPVRSPPRSTRHCRMKSGQRGETPWISTTASSPIETCCSMPDCLA